MYRFAAAVLGLTLLTACSEAGTAAPATTTSALSTTSTAPARAHGELLEQVDVDAGLGVPTYAIRYTSTSSEDEPIEVTGLVAVPERPTAIVTWAHGTTGLDDACAPSVDPTSAIGWMGPLVDRGWIVAATDYEGLGTPGRHPYLHGTSEGRSTLDIVRAANRLAGVDDLPTLVWGHSQGGHAALFAGELASTWTPELDVRGVVASAPASELPLIARTLRDGGGVAGFLGMLLAGWADAEPARADLSLILTPEAIDALAAVPATGCTAAWFAAVGGLEGRFTIADPSATEPWSTMLVENDPGHVATDIPILVLHGESDATVPSVLSQLYHDRVCVLEQDIERRTYPGADHASVIDASWADMVTWMQARLDGEATRPTCAASTP